MHKYLNSSQVSVNKRDTTRLFILEDATSVGEGKPGIPTSFCSLKNDTAREGGVMKMQLKEDL